MGHITVQVYYKSPDQDKKADEVYFSSSEKLLESRLVMVGHFNLPDTYCKGNTAGHKQSRTLLEDFTVKQK